MRMSYGGATLRPRRRQRDRGSEGSSAQWIASPISPGRCPDPASHTTPISARAAGQIAICASSSARDATARTDSCGSVGRQRRPGQSIDVFEIAQFIAINIYELGKFNAEGRRIALSEFIARYNEIVDEVETDPGLKIEVKQ